MTRTAHRLAAGIAALAAVTALSSCSTATKDKADAGSDKAGVTSSAEQGSAHNSADVMFAQMMIPHHEQAVELGAMAPEHTSDQALIKLAGAVLTQQQPEINAMKATLAQWGVNPDQPADHAGHTMSGMVDAATMAKLRTLQGPEFDKLWLKSMIGHHEGAIDMAKSEVNDGKSQEMLTIANGIIAGQQTEIDQMKQMLAALGG